MSPLRRTGAAVWRWIRPAVWLLAAVGAAATAFPSSSAFYFESQYFSYENRAPSVGVARSDYFFVRPASVLHPVLLNTVYPLPPTPRPLPEDRELDASLWGFDLRRHYGSPGDSMAPSVSARVSLWPMAMAYCLVAGLLRRLRGDRQSPPGLLRRLARPWIGAAAILGGLLVCDAFYDNHFRGLYMIGGQAEADRLWGPAFLDVERPSERTDRHVHEPPKPWSAGHGFGLRFGRGSSYLFLNVHVGLLALFPSLTNLWTLFRLARPAVTPEV